MDLARISITTLVDQYLLAVSNAERFDLMQAADWLVMTAWLTRPKSRLLLPVEPEAAQDAAQAMRAAETCWALSPPFVTACPTGRRTCATRSRTR